MHSSELKIDWATHEAAKFAVEHWHYSQRLPVGPLVKIGVWEAGKFVGVVLFSRGASPTLGNAYELTQTEVCELTRIALRQHSTPVSRIMAIATKFMHRHCPGMRLVVSFADPDRSHHGGIYQANGWIYTGCSVDSLQRFHEGRWKHSREISGGAFGGSRKVQNYQALPSRISSGKHRYLLPLDKSMREQVEKLRQPYPKRVGSAVSGTAIPIARDSATLIPTLSDNVSS
jgi:hypothetical protein